MDLPVTEEKAIRIEKVAVMVKIGAITPWSAILYFNFDNKINIKVVQGITIDQKGEIKSILFNCIINRQFLLE